MKLSYKELKAINATGKIKMIYYSSGSRWWTHDPDDLLDAREAGYISQAEHAERILADPRVPETKKEQIRGLLQVIEQSEHRIPCDPGGFALFQSIKVDLWIDSAADKPEFFGKHGVDAFMKAHHKNCGGVAFKTWDEVNAAIDNDLEKEKDADLS